MAGLRAASFDLAGLGVDVTASGEPEFISATALFAVRCAFALLTIAVQIWDWHPSQAYEAVPGGGSLWSGSKLNPEVVLRLDGPSKLTAFTELCWLLQLVYFICAIAYSCVDTSSLPEMVANSAAIAIWLAFQVSWACALLSALLRSDAWPCCVSAL